MKVKSFIILTLIHSIINQGSVENLQILKDICQKSNIKYKKFKSASSINEYLNNINYNLEEEKNRTIDSELYKLLSQDDLTKEPNPSEKYLFAITNKYIFNKGVLIICLLWNIFVFSLILGKCFCLVHMSASKLFAKKYTNWGKIIFVVVSLLSLIPIILSQKFENTVNNASCALVRFLQEIKVGNSTYNEGRIFSKPYNWLGLLNIDNVLLDIQNFFNKTGDYRKEVFKDINNIEKNITRFGQKIENLEKFAKNISIIYYNRKVYPLYVDEFNDMNKKGTRINNIMNIYKEPLDKNFLYMLNINDTNTYLEKINPDFQNEIGSVYNKTNLFSKLISQKSINITYNVQFLHEYGFNYIWRYLAYFYIFNIIVSMFLLAFMKLFSEEKTFCFKIILHFGWNMCMIIILVSFIESYFLFSLMRSFYHLIYIFHDVILNINENKFFNICLNGDGNMYNIMEPNEVIKFYELNDFYYLIKRQIRLVENFEDKKIIDSYIKDIKKWEKNISLTTNEHYNFIDINHLIERLWELTGDKWASDRLLCGETPYFYKEIILDLTPDLKVNKSFCLLIPDDYTKEELIKIYNLTNESNKLYELHTILSNLNSYYKQNKLILTNLTNILTDLNKEYNELISLINSKSKSINELAYKYLELIPFKTEGESLSSLLNCGILKDELIAFFDLNLYSYYYSLLFGFLSLSTGFFTFLGVILIINSIQWMDYEELKNNKDNPEVEEQELDEILEESREECSENPDEKK